MISEKKQIVIGFENLGVQVLFRLIMKDLNFREFCDLGIYVWIIKMQLADKEKA